MKLLVIVMLATAAAAPQKESGGCYMDSTRYESDSVNSGVARNIYSAAACQKSCKEHTKGWFTKFDCRVWSWHGRLKYCFMYGGKTVKKSDIFAEPMISGPKNCPETQTKATTQAPTPVKQTTACEWFYITSADPAAKGKVVDIPNAKKNRQLLLYDKNGADHQLWKWDRGYLVSKHNGLVMDYSNDNTKPSGTVIAWDERHKGSNQKWEQDGQFISTKSNGMALQATGTENNAEIKMRPQYEDASMKWDLQPGCE